MRNFIMALSVFFAAFNVFAHEGHEHTQSKSGNLAISVAFDAAGNLWRAGVKDGFVQVDKSSDNGKTFTKPLPINLVPQKIAAEGEARPKIAFGPEGNIYLTWTEMLAKPFTGYIWFARSINGGKTFEKPLIVHQDRAEITHRFDALDVAPNGNITVLWVDKRDLISTKAAGKAYDGAAIYYAVSTNKGATFNLEQKLSDSSCECCRIVTTNKPDGSVVAMWRHVFDGSERDHMIAEIPAKPNQAPVLKRATFGHWKIDGCPHQGPAIATGGEGKDWWGYHMAYFDGNDTKPGLYYSRMDGVAWASSPAKKFGNNANQAGHPSLLSMGENVWLVWRELEAKNYKIVGMQSDDGGKSWSGAKVLANSIVKADYPQLLSKAKQVYLSWNTVGDYQLLPLN